MECKIATGELGCLLYFREGREGEDDTAGKSLLHFEAADLHPQLH